MAPVQQLGEVSWSVVCSACCHVTLIFCVMHLYNIYIYLFSFIAMSSPVLNFFKHLILINRRNGPRYQRVLALCAFLNRGDTEGTKSSKISCSMFVYVLFYVNLCQD